MARLDTQRFDRLSETEVLDRIGVLLAIAIGRREQQRQLAAQLDAVRAEPAAYADLATLDLTQLVTDPIEARIITHLRAAGQASARTVAAALGVTASVVAQKLARLSAAGLCRIEERSRPACYRLRSEYSAN